MAYILDKSDSCGAVFQDAATLDRSLPALAEQASSNGNGTSSAVSLFKPKVLRDLGLGTCQASIESEMCMNLKALSQHLRQLSIYP